MIFVTTSRRTPLQELLIFQETDGLLIALSLCMIQKQPSKKIKSHGIWMAVDSIPHETKKDLISGPFFMLNT